MAATEPTGILSDQKVRVGAPEAEPSCYRLPSASLGVILTPPIEKYTITLVITGFPLTASPRKEAWLTFPREVETCNKRCLQAMGICPLRASSAQGSR